MAISSVSNAASYMSAATIQQLDPAKKTEDKKPIQPAEVKPAEAKQPAATSSLGSVINTTA